MIHVAYSLTDKTGRYSKLTGTSILSMFENSNSKITVHILHDNTLSDDNRSKFKSLAKRYKQIIKFYNVELSYADKIAEFKEMLPTLNTQGARTIGTLFKFLIPHVLEKDIKKYFYFDSDIIINSDVKELEKFELGNNSIGAVPEIESYVDTSIHTLIQKNIVNPEDYFNAGFMIMNPEKLRNENELIVEGIKFRMENTDCDCTDQDIYNYCFSKNYLKLPGKYNTLVEYARNNSDYNIENRICHYTTSAHGMGFGLDMKDAYNKMFLEYFAKTPWFTAEVIGRIYEGVQNIYVEQKAFATYVSAMMSGKSRAFYMTSGNTETFKQIFDIRADEEIISADSEETIKNLVSAMKKSAGKKVFIILTPPIPAITQMIYEALQEAGFEENKDFIHGANFLSDATGMPMNPYDLIKLM